jgi:hypothetical protein
MWTAVKFSRTVVGGAPKSEKCTRRPGARHLQNGADAKLRPTAIILRIILRMTSLPAKKFGYRKIQDGGTAQY